MIFKDSKITNPAPTMTLDALPDELLLLIASHLNVPSLLCLCLVSKKCSPAARETLYYSVNLYATEFHRRDDSPIQLFFRSMFTSSKLAGLIHKLDFMFNAKDEQGYMLRVGHALTLLPRLRNWSLNILDVNCDEPDLIIRTGLGFGGDAICSNFWGRDQLEVLEIPLPCSRLLQYHSESLRRLDLIHLEPHARFDWDVFADAKISLPNLQYFGQNYNFWRGFKPEASDVRRFMGLLFTYFICGNLQYLDITSLWGDDFPANMLLQIILDCAKRPWPYLKRLRIRYEKLDFKDSTTIKIDTGAELDDPDSLFLSQQTWCPVVISNVSNDYAWGLVHTYRAKIREMKLVRHPEDVLNWMRRMYAIIDDCECLESIQITVIFLSEDRIIMFPEELSSLRAAFRKNGVRVVIDFKVLGETFHDY